MWWYTCTLFLCTVILPAHGRDPGKLPLKCTRLCMLFPIIAEITVVQPGLGAGSEVHFHCPPRGITRLVVGVRWLINGTELNTTLDLSGKFEFSEHFSPNTETGLLTLFNFSLDANGTLIQCQARLRARDGRY